MTSKAERLAAAEREEEALVKALANLRERRAAIESKLEFVQPEDGAVVKWQHGFRTSGPKYSYAAVRVGDNWFLTGTRGDSIHPHTWEELTDLWERREASGIVVATAFLPLSTR